MHQSLHTLEISAIVCSYLKVEGALASLASLATTCRTLEAPALDALWREQGSLANLIQCLPSTFWDKTVNRGGFNLRQFEPIISTDFPRFYEYANRIRMLSLENSKHSVSYSLLQLLARTIGAPLLPNLRRLTCMLDDDTEFSALDFLLGPRIQYVRLSLTGDPRIRLSFLHLLSKCTSLVSLDVQYDVQYSIVPDYTIKAINCIIPKFTFLQALVIPALHESAFPALASFSSLKSLTLGTVNSPFSTTDPLPGSFNSLCFLTVTAVCMADVTRILFTLRSSPLEKLHCHVKICPLPEALEALFEAIHDNCRKDFLRSVRVSAGQVNAHKTDISMYTMPSTSLERLFSFTKISNFELLMLGLETDDELLRRISDAWPLLERLVFTWRPKNHTPPPPRVTMAGLCHIVQRCKRLNTLGVELQTADVEAEPYQRPASRTLDASLKSLKVGRSPITQPIPIAAFLSDAFPGLKEVVSVETGADDLRQQWQQVSELVKWFIMVRQQERASINSVTELSVTDGAASYDPTLPLN